jgi:hypothetical protein
VDGAVEWSEDAATMTTLERSQVPREADEPTRLTVIIETMTHEEYRKAGTDRPRTRRVLDALEATTAPTRVDVLIMSDRAVSEATESIDGHPEASVVPVDEPTYYTMKNAGARAAASEYVAFLDGDCLPGPGWAAAAVAALDAGADVVAGKTRYAGPGALSKLMGYFDLGTVSTRSDGTASAFHLNNVAFRRDVFLSNPLDTRFRRSGGCVLANFQLRAANRRIVYEPAMYVTHGNDWKKGFGLSKRLGSGHNTVNVLRYDDTGAVPYAWITRLGPLAAPLVAVRRIWDDLFLLVRQHEDLGIPMVAIPLVWLIAIPFRLLEGVGYAISSVKPSIIGKYWG